MQALFKTDQKQIREERDCSTMEFWVRRAYSSVFYYRFYRKRNPENPYFTPKVVEFLEQYLDQESSNVFEWGSGTSTIWLASKVKSLTSIEHNPEWFDRVNTWLEKDDFRNVQLEYILPKDNNFSNYIHAIEKYDDDFFDLVTVDGRCRVDCVEQAVKKVKLNGYLILDDSHRNRYQKAFSLLSNYDWKRYDFGLLQTTIFQRLR